MAAPSFGVRGYVSAYDPSNGSLIWRFYTVPGDPSLGFENATLANAATTWKGQRWLGGGGGTVWDSMAYDSTLDLLDIGVGNGSPWNQKIRAREEGTTCFCLQSSGCALIRVSMFGITRKRPAKCGTTQRRSTLSLPI